MTHSDEFTRLYNMLNREQREAVDTTEGPVMVIAGPGTGKTQILTLRIANILKKSDVPADAILALTFTNAGATNMRKRLVSIIGSDAYRVSIFTFHSFANHLIDSHPETFSDAIGKSNSSEVERIDIVRALLDTGQYALLRPLSDPYHNVTNIISAISHLKREGINPNMFSAWIEEERLKLEQTDDLYHTKGVHKGKMKSVYIKACEKIKKNEELARIYGRYQEELGRRKRFDFDDSLLMLIDAMEQSDDFLRELQEEYQYFLVDEHQDTNGAQNRILELLATYFDTPNLFVVGDEKQAIFRFQGASLANFLYFEKKFSDVKRVTLHTNYRSHQNILDASHELIQKNTDTIHAPLTSNQVTPGKAEPGIAVHTFDAEDEELLYLTESIKKRIASGTPPHEIAVLYRNNADVEAISDYFERLAIPFLVESGHGVLDDPDIRKINLILRSLSDLEHDALLTKALFIDFLCIPIEDIYEVGVIAKREKESVFGSLIRFSKTKNADEPIAQYVKKMLRWKKISENESFLHVFETVIRESGVLSHIQASSFHMEKFDKLVRLFDEMKSHVRRTPFFTVSDYCTFLSILEEHNLTLEAKSRQVPNSVRLMTAHKAKGLEFDHVYIVHAYDGHWGGKRRRTHFLLPHRAGATIGAQQDEDDERRLFYVAITRARKAVYISYATHAPDGKARVPSRFIEEIRAELKTEQSGEELGYAGKRPPLFVERVGLSGAGKYREFVKASFLERGISATALNNYLTCPWKWFYENFFYTRFVPTLSQLKGIAMHDTLEAFFNERNKNPRVTDQHLVSLFKKYIEMHDMEAHDMARITKEATDALVGWYTKWHELWEEKTVNEVLIRGVLLDDTIRLTGKLDKLECLDSTCHEVRVVDYKTGKPKSRNEIEGATEKLKSTPGSGGYKRQLIFYKLLLMLHAGGKYNMREAQIDFVEPTKSGTYKRESFTVSAGDVEELKETIRKVSKEITTLSFWDGRCQDDACSACALRDLMG